MATLEELRVRLDEIDDQIVKLYEERMEVCENVGRYKVKSGKKILDKQREKNKLADVASKVSNEFNKKCFNLLKNYVTEEGLEYLKANTKEIPI